jgi:hypothetical protein
MKQQTFIHFHGGGSWCSSFFHDQETMAGAPAKNFTRAGEQTFQKMDKINAEVFTLTYGRYRSAQKDETHSAS